MREAVSLLREQEHQWKSKGFIKTVRPDDLGALVVRKR